VNEQCLKGLRVHRRHHHVKGAAILFSYALIFTLRKTTWNKLVDILISLCNQLKYFNLTLYKMIFIVDELTS
jgi:hypothetical protein